MTGRIGLTFGSIGPSDNGCSPCLHRTATKSPPVPFLTPLHGDCARLTPASALSASVDHCRRLAAAKMWTRADLEQFKADRRAERTRAVLAVGQGEVVTVRADQS